MRLGTRIRRVESPGANPDETPNRSVVELLDRRLVLRASRQGTVGRRGCEGADPIADGAHEPAAVTDIGWACRSIKVRTPRGLARVT